MLVSVTARVSSPVMVGREADLAALREALKRTRSAEPSTVLVGGEAGVGKTRVLEEFARSAAADGVQVLVGQSLELGEEGLPYAPFAAALRELVRRDGLEVFEGRDADFARLLPELGPPEAGDARRGLLFESVAALLARLAEATPLVLVLEDVHWADRSTRDLIGFLVRSARAPQLMLVLSFRTDELHRGHPLRPFLAELDRVRGVQRLDLDRLDRDGTAALLSQLRGAEPEPGTVDTVHDRAQGNPFFIEQFAASGDECGDIPDNLRDLLLAPVDQLAEAAQRVLRIAAVAGTHFGHELLARVAGMAEAELESALRAVVASQLVVVDPAGGYEFRHALVREAVHDDLLPGEHARLHARYAEAVAAEPQLVTVGRAPAEIAHHWYAAHDHPRALVAAYRAAGDAGGRYAYGEQARLLDRVLELWEQVPDAGDRLDVSHRDLLEETALAAIEAGDHMRAMTLTRAALDDLDASAEPVRAARLLIQQGKLLRNAGRGDGAAQSRQAYALLQSAPAGKERVTLLADVAYALASVDNDEAGRIAQQVLDAASELGDAASQVSATITFGQVCAGRMPHEVALPMMREAAASARAAGDRPDLVRALVNISDSLFDLGDYEESADAAREGVPHADRVGVSRTTGVFLLANYAEALMALGRWDEADQPLAEAFRLNPPGSLALPALRLRARLRLARGQDTAEGTVGRALSFLGRSYLHKENRLSLLELRVLAARESGDAAAVAAAARAALAEPGIAENPRYGWPVLAAVARALDRAADPGLPALLRTVAAATPAVREAHRAYAAQVAATLDDDAAGWRSAVAHWRADGQRYPLAVALLGAASACAAAGDRAAAAEAIEEVRAIASALDAQPLRAEAETMARRIGIRSATPAGAEVLTSREREVLRLVAEGHSNSRIAEQLYISPKTASVHVSRIIAKLDVANRTEAAAVARRLGLLGP